MLRRKTIAVLSRRFARVFAPADVSGRFLTHEPLLVPQATGFERRLWCRSCSTSREEMGFDDVDPRSYDVYELYTANFCEQDNWHEEDVVRDTLGKICSMPKSDRLLPCQGNKNLSNIFVKGFDETGGEYAQMWTNENGSGWRSEQGGTLCINAFFGRKEQYGVQAWTVSDFRLVARQMLQEPTFRASNLIDLWKKLDLKN